MKKKLIYSRFFVLSTIFRLTKKKLEKRMVPKSKDENLLLEENANRN